jgi:hypothetical protein
MTSRRDWGTSTRPIWLLLTPEDAPPGAAQRLVVGPSSGVDRHLTEAKPLEALLTLLWLLLSICLLGRVRRRRRRRRRRRKGFLFL